MLETTSSYQRKDRPDLRKRGLIACAPFVLLAACQETGGTAASPSTLQFTSIAPPRPGSTPLLPVPQFYLGQETAPSFTEIGFSLHCGASRDWFLQQYRPLWRAAKAGQRSAMFSHVIRTEAELEAGIAVMAVGPDAYPDAMFAVIALTLAEGRPLSAREIGAFLPSAGYPRRGQTNDDHSKAALMAVRVLYEGINVKATPYVNEVKRS